MGKIIPVVLPPGFTREEREKLKQSWGNMTQRTTNPNNTNYQKYYKQLGIDPAWLTYSRFEADMAQSYLVHVRKHGFKNTTIERVDNDKGYSKANCKWATLAEQHRNMSTCIPITIKGRTLIFSDWCTEFGVKPENVINRSRKLKLPYKEVLLLGNKYPKRVCKDCRRSYTPTGSTQVRCGSLKGKTGCIYKHVKQYQSEFWRRRTLSETVVSK